MPYGKMVKNRSPKKSYNYGINLRQPEISLAILPNVDSKCTDFYMLPCKIHCGSVQNGIRHKIWNPDFWQNFWCLTKFLIFDKLFNFWQNFWYLTKFLIFDRIFNFWQNFQFLTKFSIFNKIFNFWQNFRLLTKFSIFDKIFILHQKFLFFL